MFRLCFISMVTYRFVVVYFTQAFILMDFTLVCTLPFTLGGRRICEIT